MSLYPYAENQYPPAGADIFFLPGAITLERPFRCVPGGLPCNRPIVRVRHAAVGYLGEIRQPSCGPFFNFHFDVVSPQRGPGSEDMLPNAPLHVHPARAGEPEGTKWYTIRGDLIQPGMFMFLPCAPFNKINFTIYDGTDEALTKPVGMITKVFNPCCASAIADADSFTIRFPPAANEVQRACLIAATILIEFRMFHKNPKRDGAKASCFGPACGYLDCLCETACSLALKE
jgi:hypothetical protein